MRLAARAGKVVGPMAIEFRCTQCQKLLSVADNTEGKQAKCPNCGATLKIPALPIVPAAPAGDQPTPSAGGSEAPAPLGSPTVNPYQSPAPEPAAAATGERTGPEWERLGRSVGSFFATVRDSYSSPSDFFGDMRREGGLVPPMWFGVIAGTISIAAAMTYNALLQGALAANTGDNQQFVVAVFGGCCYTLLGPFLMIAGMFLGAGISHLMLMLVGGANHPFETTFRITAYATGASCLLQLVPVPIVNGCAYFLVDTVFLVYGLMRGQEIPATKALMVVFVPLVVCCLVSAGGLAIAAAVAGNAGGG
jgi:hypothetical protein